MLAGWTLPGADVLRDVGAPGDDVPLSMTGDVMTHDEVQIAGDGELIQRNPYLYWKPEDTRIITYVLGHAPVEGIEAAQRRGRRVTVSVKQARAEVLLQHGEILEENAAGDNVFFRVRRTK